MNADHLTIHHKPNGGIEADCAVCQMGFDVGPRFGPISAEAMLTAFIEQHAHKAKKARR